MSIEKAKKYLEEKGYADRVIEPDVSTATVELAAAAIGVEPGRICKSLSFLIDERPILILEEGMDRVDNKKYKAQFGKKAKMIPREEVEGYIGHEAGGGAGSACILWGRIRTRHRTSCRRASCRRRRRCGRRGWPCHTWGTRA